MTSKKSPDEILEHLGGCGLFQWRLTILVHVMKALVCWSMMSMILMAAKPGFTCDDGGSIPGLQTKNGTITSHNQSLSSEVCLNVNGTSCQSFKFSGEMKTVVSEFSLVCDQSHIPSTTMSVQMGGVLVGTMVAGQVATLYGRKIPLYASMVILVLFNFMAYFSINWGMFMVARFFIGTGCGSFLAIQFSLLSEFTLAKFRAWTIGFPSWPIERCFLALAAWLLPNWRHLQLAIALAGIPFLATWWCLPESFRWYISHDRYAEAENIVRDIAKANKREMPDMSTVIAGEQPEKDTKYTLKHLFQSKFLVRVTLLSLVNWFTLGVVYHGLNFGVSALSGNLYLNFFLFSVSSVPTKVMSMWLSNSIGRKKTSMLCYGTVAIGGFVVGIVQQIDTEYRNLLTNLFAIIASIGVTTAYGPVQTITIELYPTVIRALGFGCLSTVLRVGAVVGPQLVFVSQYVPGLIYFVCGGIATICVFGLIGLPETMDENLSDKIQSEHVDIQTDKTKKNQGSPQNILKP